MLVVAAVCLVISAFAAGWSGVWLAVSMLYHLASLHFVIAACQIVAACALFNAAVDHGASRRR